MLYLFPLSILFPENGVSRRHSPSPIAKDPIIPPMVTRKPASVPRMDSLLRLYPCTIVKANTATIQHQWNDEFF